MKVEEATEELEWGKLGKRRERGPALSVEESLLYLLTKDKGLDNAESQGGREKSLKQGVQVVGFGFPEMQ